MALLEREAGVSLFERAGRSIRLTDAGVLLARYADTITGVMAAAEADMARLRSALTGTLRVAAFPTAALTIMPVVMAKLGAIHPDLRLTLKDLEVDESLTAVATGEVDVAIVARFREDDIPLMLDLEFVEVLRDPLYLAARDSPVLPRPVHLSAVRNQPWIMDTEGSLYYAAVMRACRAEGFEPHVRANCRDFSVITALIEAGQGVGLLPGLALAGRPPTLTVADIEPQIWRSVLAVVRAERRRHPAIELVIDELRKFGATYQPIASR